MMTMQQMFDRAALGLLTQGKKSAALWQEQTSRRRRYQVRRWLPAAG
jgi:hypothetical protein